MVEGNLVEFFKFLKGPGKVLVGFTGVAFILALNDDERAGSGLKAGPEVILAADLPGLGPEKDAASFIISREGLSKLEGEVKIGRAACRERV